jgi:hypothetical protein
MADLLDVSLRIFSADVRAHATLFLVGKPTATLSTNRRTADERLL